MRRADRIHLLPAAVLVVTLVAPGLPMAQEEPAHPAPAPGGVEDGRGIEAVTQRVLCPCGTCVNQTLHECTCGTAAMERDKVAGLMAAGTGADAIIQSYVDEHGLQILNAPDKTGFNLFGWLVPFIVAIVGLLSLTLVLRGWIRSAASRPAAVPSGPEGDADPVDPNDRRYRDRLEEELKDIQI